MAFDRITELRIAGLRVIDELTLPLSGLMVLIGDNGTGKSTILEALELLRHTALPIDFENDAITKRYDGGMQALLRRNDDVLRLGVTVEGGTDVTRYDIHVIGTRGHPEVTHESLHTSVDNAGDGTTFERWYTRKGTSVLTGHRQRRGEQVLREQESQASNTLTSRLMLTHVQGTGDELPTRMVRALANIEVHVPFETRPRWQQRELGINVGPRVPSPVENTESLSRHGVNLPNAFQRIRNTSRDAWERTVALVRLGLGDDVRDILLPPVGRGNIELTLVFGSAPDRPLPADYLSEGQLSYLAFVAISQLHQNRSVLAFDEPELHLHPALLNRVLHLFEGVAATTPVILATHSDRLLDALADPAASVRGCSTTDGHLRVERLDPERLDRWLKEYRGLGDVRAEGFLSQVIAERT